MPTQPNQFAAVPALDATLHNHTSNLNLAPPLSTDRTPAPHAYPVPRFLASRRQTPAVQKGTRKLKSTYHSRLKE